MPGKADKAGNTKAPKSPSESGATSRAEARECTGGGYNPHNVSVGLARVDRLREKGRQVASYLRTHPDAFQEQAALTTGIVPKTYYEWLKGTGEAEQAFQAEVLPAIYELAAAAEARAESDIACVESGSSAWAGWHKWKLAQRFRKVFGDLAQKHEVEVSGPGGGPLQVDVVSKMSDAELRKAALGDSEGDE